jgi:hypothetical protein
MSALAFAICSLKIGEPSSLRSCVMSSIRSVQSCGQRGVNLILLAVFALSAPGVKTALGDEFKPELFLEENSSITTDPYGPLAVSETGVVAHWREGRIVFRGEDLSKKHSIKSEIAPVALALDPHARLLYSAEATGTVRCRQVTDGVELWSATLATPIGSLEVARHGRFLAAAANKTLALLGEQGKSRGELKIQPSGLKRKGKALSLAVFIRPLELLAVVEARRVLLVSTKRSGFGKTEPVVVKLPGVATSACMNPDGRGVLVGTSKGLVNVPTKGRAKLLSKTPSARSLVQLSGGGPVVAGLAKTKAEIVLFSQDQGLKPTRTYAFGARVGEQLVVSKRGWVYFVSRTQSDPPEGHLDVLDGSNGRLRSGALPKGASDMRFLADGSLSCLVRHEGYGDDDPSSVTLWKWTPEGEQRLITVLKGTMLTEDKVAFVQQNKGKLALVDRATGRAKDLGDIGAPKDTQVSLQQGRFVVWPEGDRYAVWDAAADTRLGAFSAMSQRALAISPDGGEVVRAHKGKLVCDVVAGGSRWSQAAAAVTGVEISADGQRLNAVGLGLVDMEDGEPVVRIEGASRFSMTGRYLLVNQVDRAQQPARILDAENGKQLWALKFVRARTRRKASAELLLLDAAGKSVVVRFHGKKRKGLWLYRRAG